MKTLADAKKITTPSKNSPGKKLTTDLKKIPKSVQSTVQITRIAPDGIFEIIPGKLYDKAYNFSDINYSIQDYEDQELILDLWCQFLASMSVPFKIVIANHQRNLKKFREMVFYKNTETKLNALSDAFNEYFFENLSDSHENIEQKRYLIVSAERKDYKAAVEFFTTVENNIRSIFRSLDSSFHSLSTKDRLELLHRIYRLGHEGEFLFDMESSLKNGKDFKNSFVPDYLQEHEDYMMSDGKFYRTLYVRNFPYGSIKDSFLKELTSAPYHTVTTLDIVPIPKDEAIQFVLNKYLGVQRTIDKMQRWRMQNNAILSDIPYDTKKDSQDLQSLYELLKETDENLYYCGITTVITANSKQELDNITESIQQIAAGCSMGMAPHWLRQMDAFKTTLPVAGRYIRTSRTLNTASMAKLIPFNALELMDNGGICYGKNVATKNLIFGNRRLLLNQNGFILSTSGSGKTFMAKSEIEQTALRYPKDHQIIIDPKGEYRDMMIDIDGEFMDISVQSHHHINPLEYSELTQTDPMAFVKQKSEFLLSLCDAACKEGISDEQRSIIDRCVNILYTRVFEKGIDMNKLPVVTLKDFYGILKAQPGQEAERLSSVLEIFVTGSLNIFAHPTNVNLNNQRITFGISGVSKDLWGISMLTIIEFIKSRIKTNFKNGIFTWFYCDEFHELLGKEYTESYMESFWKEMRSFGSGCTGITQNISDLLENKRTRNMISNSEFVLMLNQSSHDLEELVDMFALSHAQAGHITKNAPGNGLLKFGNKVIPFSMEIPESSLIYQMNNSDPASK